MLAPTGICGLDDVIRGFPKGGLILVAGNPGTGKTVFSASYIYNGVLKYGEKGVYVSLSEDKEAFYEYMNAFDMDFEKLEKEGLFEFISLLTLREDAVVSQIQEIIDAISRMKAKRLVIDSFTALTQGVADTRQLRVFLHSILSKIIRDLSCTTILVEEVPYGDEEIGYGFEEFVADGILLLKTTRLDGRLFRELTIAKMRGTSVQNPDLAFTLTEGFRVFPPFRYRSPKEVKNFKAIPDKTAVFSTGIPDLDDILGGFAEGSTVLVEVDPRLRKEEYMLFITPIILNYAKKGKGVIVIPPVGINYDDYLKMGELYSGLEKEFFRRFRMIEPAELLEEPIPEWVFSWRFKTPEEDYKIFLKVEKRLMDLCGSPPIRVIGASMLAHYYGVDGAVTFANFDIARVKRTRGLSIWLVEPVYPNLIDRLAPLASTYLKLTREHGCVIFYGIKPRTTLYAVELEASKEYSELRLIPIT